MLINDASLRILILGKDFGRAFGPLGPRTGTRSLDFEFEADPDIYAETV